jgi:iron complex outermembrane receptor protein
MSWSTRIFQLRAYSSAAAGVLCRLLRPRPRMPGREPARRLAGPTGRAAVAGLCTVLCLPLSLDAATPLGRVADNARLYDFDIAGQDLHSSLQAVALTANLRLLYRSDIVRGVVSPSLKARCTAQQAIEALLAGTNLSYEQLSSGVVLIRRTDPTLADRIREMVALRREAAEAEGVHAGNEQTDDNPAVLEEIIVTAQKREESAQAIPVAINVVSGRTLVEEGVREVKDVGKASTALEINTRQGQATVVGMRGMQQQGFSPTGDTLTAVHLDGVFLSNFWGMNGMMFDLERVEVMAGPQGTLYGRNSAAGAINLITTRPGDHLAANASLEYGSFNTLRADGGISMPLTDTLALRVAGTRYTRDALYSDGEAAIDQWAGRLSVNWQPTPVDTLYFTYDHINTGGTNEGGGLYAVDPNVRAYDTATNAFLPSPPESVTRFISTVGDPYDNAAYVAARGQVFSGHIQSVHWGAMAQYTHDFGPFDAVMLVSHRELEAISQTATKAATAAYPQTYPQVADSDVAELRLVSDDQGSWKWVGGLFWLKSAALHGNSVPNSLAPGAGFPGFVMTATGPVSTLGTAPPDPNTGLNVPGCPCISGFSPVNGGTTAYAAYSQATWTPENLQRWHFTGGLRYSYDRKSTTQGYYVNSVLQSLWVPDENSIPDFLAASIITPAQAAGTNIPPTVLHTNGSGTWSQVQYRFGVEYTVDDRSMLYGTIATGYKSGGFAYGSTPKLKPETLLAYEIGSKNRFLGDSLQLNMAAWWYDYTDLEVPMSRPIPPPFPVVNNVPQTVVPSVASAGRVHLGGFSFDFDWAVTPRDRLGLSSTYIYSRIVDGREILDGVVTEVIREGQRLGDAPKWQWLGRYSHRFDLAGGASIVPALKYQWQSRKYDGGAIPAGSVLPGATSVDPVRGTFNLAREVQGQTTIPQQWIMDLQVKFVPAGSAWDLTAYVHNLTDELEIKQLFYASNPLGGGPTGNYGHTTALLGEPRTVGVILNVRF